MYKITEAILHKDSEAPTREGTFLSNISHSYKCSTNSHPSKQTNEQTSISQQENHV